VEGPIAARIEVRSRHVHDDLLDTAKIEARHLYVEREACAVVPLIKEAMDLPQTLAATKNIEFQSDVSADLPRVFVDRHRTLQVLQI